MPRRYAIPDKTSSTVFAGAPEAQGESTGTPAFTSPDFRSWRYAGFGSPLTRSKSRQPNLREVCERLERSGIAQRGSGGSHHMLSRMLGF